MPIIILALVVVMCVLFSKLTWILLPLAVFAGVAVMTGFIRRRCVA